MKLYGYWRSSATYRVRILLSLKGLDYEYVPVHLMKDGGEQNSPSFAAKNPLRQVPVLEMKGPSGPLYLTQSMAIAEFLEEAHPEPALLPKDAWSRARAREVAEIINAGIQPLQNSRVLQSLRSVGLHPQSWCQEVIGRGFHAVEARLSADGYTPRSDPGLIEAFVVPQIYGARRFELDLAPFPTLLALEAASLGHPAFVRAHPDAQIDAPPPEERTP